MISHDGKLSEAGTEGQNTDLTQKRQDAEAREFAIDARAAKF